MSFNWCWMLNQTHLMLIFLPWLQDNKILRKLDSSCLIFIYQYVRILFSFRKKNIDIIHVVAVKKICRTYFHVKQQKQQKSWVHFLRRSDDTPIQTKHVKQCAQWKLYFLLHLPNYCLTG